MMRNAVKRKLKSNEGASLMVALLFFVVCAVIGSIVLTAATVGSGRVNGIKKYNQNYYALKSATAIFDEEFSRGYQIRLSHNGATAKVDDVLAEENGGYLFYTTNLIGTRDLLARDVYSDNLDGSSEDHIYNYEINVGTVEELKAKVKMLMHPSYDMDVMVYIESEEGSGEPNGYFTLKYTASVSTDEDDLTTVTWVRTDMQMGGNFNW